MSRFAYVNGRYCPFAEASVHIEDRGYQFADAVYEVVYVRGGRPIDAGLHLDRLDRSLAALAIRPPMGRAALGAVLAEMVRRNRISEGLLYLQVSRGVARREHAFPALPPAPALVVTLRRLPPYPSDPARWAGRAVTRPDERWGRCDIKTTNLLPNVLAKQAAREASAIEAILVDSAGMVTEGASTTVWIVDQAGRLCTRPLDHTVLPGCTRAALVDLLAGRGIGWDERRFGLADLRAAREIFLTSASGFVRPIVALDGEPVGDGTPGPVTCRLFDLFARHVQGGGHNRER